MPSAASQALTLKPKRFKFNLSTACTRHSPTPLELCAGRPPRSTLVSSRPEASRSAGWSTSVEDEACPVLIDDASEDKYTATVVISPIKAILLSGVSLMMASCRSLLLVLSQPSAPGHKAFIHMLCWSGRPM